MAVTIDWGTRIIYVPRNDLTLVQTVPSEIRSMDLNWFRVQLKNLEDSEVGMIYPDTHKHNSEVSLGGLTYARVIEIINDFTITFEDGQYAVNLVGANSNVADKVNVNQVSVRSANSAGMTSSAAIEFSSYENCVTVDVNSIYSGTLYPIGTMLKPVNNINDAVFIANSRGFNSIRLLSNIVIPFGSNIDNFNIFSSDWETEIHLENGSSCVNTHFDKLSVYGILSGHWNVFTDCWLFYVTNFAGWMIRGSLEDITLAPYNENSFGQSYFDSIVPMYPDEYMTIHMNTNTSIACTNLEGYYALTDCTDGSIALLGMSSGTIKIDSSCSGGAVEVSGVGLLINQTSGTTVSTEGFMNKENISIAVWDEPLGNHIIPGSTGSTTAISRFEGTIHIDSVLGSNNITFPAGTHSYPTNSLSNALSIDTIYGFKRYNIKNNLDITQSVSFCSFIAENSFSTDSINLNNQSLSHIGFYNVTVSGSIQSGQALSFYNCYLKDINNVSGEVYGGRLSGLLRVSPGDVFSGIDVVLEGDNTVIDLQNSINTTVSLDINSGIVTFINSVASCLIELNLRGGEVVLNSSCVGGDFYAEGYGTLYNDSNMTIKDNHLLALETIPPYILNSLTADYMTVGTIGKAISDASVGGIAIIDETTISGIAAGTWNFLKEGSGISGSYGEHIKSLGGSGNNLVSVYANNIIRVIGSDQGGTISNTQAHDDSYFSTGELAGQGLEVIFEASSNHTYIPNSIRLSGFYAGSTSHSVSINVYNFVLNVYENKGIMLSRSTPFTYTVPLEQDNIDLNGTMRVQLLHITSTYISNHRLHIDYIQFDLTNTYDSLSSDIVAIKNRTDQLSFTLGRLNSNTQMISDTVSSADLLEANVANLNLPITTLDTKLDSLTSSVQSLPTVAAITTAVWSHSKASQISTDVKFVRDIEGGKWEITNNQMIFYAEDNITEIARFNLYNENGVLSNTNIFSRIKL